MPRTSNSCQKAVMAQAPNRIPTPMVKAANRTPKPKSTGCRSGHGLRYNISHPHRASQLSPPHRQRAHPFLNIPRPVHLARRTTYPVSRRGGRRWCHLGKNTQSARHRSRVTGRSRGGRVRRLRRSLGSPINCVGCHGGGLRRLGTAPPPIDDPTAPRMRGLGSQTPDHDNCTNIDHHANVGEGDRQSFTGLL